MHIQLVESMCRSIDDFQTPLRWNQIIEEIVARSSNAHKGLAVRKAQGIRVGERQGILPGRVLPWQRHHLHPIFISTGLTIFFHNTP
jgi:hypothetical protein